MSFDTELAKLQRVRRAHLRFARELNPTGPWVGAEDRRYGKVPDPTGAVPVIGTVESFGTFQSHLANHEFTLEVPSAQTTLLDPTNEWRAMADRPSHLLLNRQLGYVLRQQDDDGNSLDQLIAIGQVAAPTFPPGKVRFDVKVPGGDFLGEDAGRRFITTRDWPRALPENIGKIVPFVYGALSNIPPSVSMEAGVCGSLRLLTSFGGGNTGLAMENPGGGGGGIYERTPYGPDALDAAHPNILSSEGVRTYAGLGPAGETVVDSWYPGSIGNSGPPDYHNYVTSGVSFAEFGSLGLDAAPEVIQMRGAWPADYGCATADYRLTAASLQGVIYAPAFIINRRSHQNSYSLEWIVTSTSHGGGVYGEPYYFVLGVRNWSGYTYHESAPFTEAEMFALSGDWKQWRLRWRCGTPTINEGTGFFSGVASDGIVRATIGDTVIFDLTGSDLFMEDSLYPGQNVGNALWLGYFGLIGPVTNVSLQSGAFADGGGGEEDPAPLDICGGLEEASGGRGGWLQAPLVDVGTLALEDAADESLRPTITTEILAQPHPAPTGLAGNIVPGGNGVPGSTLYYAIAGVYGGVVSELSNVIGPFSPAGDEAIDLTWNALSGSPDGVRVYRGTDPSFNQMDRYRANPSAYPYSISDLPGSATSLTDLRPGVNTREYEGTDPQWDLIYRQQKYYAVSARYDDGTASPCSVWSMVELAPRNGPLTVRVTWAPPAGGGVIASYIVRRMNQNYHWETVLDRQWEFNASTLTFDDPNTDTSAASACGDDSEGGCGSGRPKYLLAGHTLKAVTGVFVKKPNPALEGTDLERTAVWVRMVEGTDYTHYVCERNGNRYHVLEFTELQRSDVCEFYEVTANVEGVETNGDGTGTLLTSFDDIFEHIMLNIVFNTYRSSIGIHAPPGGAPYFTDVSWSPGLFNRASVAAAKAVAESRIPGGYRGAGALTEQTSTRQLIHDLLVTGDLELYQHHGVWYVRRDHPSVVVRASLPLSTPAEGIDDFEPSIQQQYHHNLLPYFGGPLNSAGSDGFLVSGELPHSDSIDIYRRAMLSEPVYLLWTQDPQTAFDVVQRYLNRFAYPSIDASFTGPVKWYTTPVGSYARITHPDGLGVAGWVQRVCKVLGVQLDLDQMVCRVLVRDVDHEIP